MLATILIAAVALAVVVLAAVRDASARRERHQLVNEQDRERQMWRNERADLLGMAAEQQASLLERHQAELQAARQDANTDRAQLIAEMLAESTRARADMVVLVDEHQGVIGELLERFERERESWRSQERELLNRVQHPTVMPTGVRPVSPARNGTASEQARAAWSSVGRAEPLSAGDDAGTDVP